MAGIEGVADADGDTTLNDGANGLGLPKNGKKVFRVSYRFDRLEELNLSNPYYHKKIQLYLYQGE